MSDPSGTLSPSARPANYSEGPKRLIRFTDKQLADMLSVSDSPLCSAAIREVLILRRDIEGMVARLNRYQVPMQ